MTRHSLELEHHHQIWFIVLPKIPLFWWWEGSYHSAEDGIMRVNPNTYIYIYIHVYIHLWGAFNKFPDFFVQAFKIVIDFWKFTMLLLYILWDDWPIFMILHSNQQLQQQLEYTLLKLDCHSWWISKMQSGHEDTLEEWYAIKFCFKNLGKMPQKRMECFGLLFRPFCMNRASVFEWHKRFKEGRESVRDDERYGRSKEVRTPELIGQIKNFMDKVHHVSIETISTQFDVSVGTVHTIIRKETEDVEDLRKVCPKGAQRKKDVVMTSGRWSRWSIQIPQFLMLWWPAMKAGSTAMTQRPRDRVPSGSMLALPDPRRSDRANPPTNFWWSLFLTALAWSTCTGFPLDRQSTRNTMLRF